MERLQVKIIDKYPEVGVVTHDPFNVINGKTRPPFINLEAKIKKNTLQWICWKEYLFSNITHASCMLISKEKAIKINGWCIQEFPDADWFFNARVWPLVTV